MKKNITIVLVSYQSSRKLSIFIKKLSSNVPIWIIDNSYDFSLKKIFKKNKNVKIFIGKNKGYSSSINFAAKKIKTQYFLVVQPDVKGINDAVLREFFKYAKIIKDNFSVIGPHFLNPSKKGHFQTNLKYKIKQIHNVHGSTMFFNKKNFLENKGFDKNIFLYWEETDYTKRCLKNGYPAYQLNTVKVTHEKGETVSTKNNEEELKLKNLYIWHFIWSKYYYYNKHFGRLLSVLFFLPIFIRILFRMMIYRNRNRTKYVKYLCRFDGLKSSLQKKKSLMRLDTIAKKKFF